MSINASSSTRARSIDPAEAKIMPAGHTWLYLRKVLRHGPAALAMKPAGRSLAKAHCAHIDAAKPQTIVEVGAGTGAVTSAIIQHMHPDSRLIAVEIDTEFAAILRQRCPRATVLACDARDLPAQLRSQEVNHIDVMISCLGMPRLPRAVNEAVFDCFATLGGGAWFAQQTIIPYLYLRRFRRLFEEVRFDLVLANLPPGGVYHCRGLKADYKRHVPGKM